MKNESMKGDIGMSWEKVNLGDLATFINGFPFKPSDWSAEGVEIIRIQNLTKGSSETNYYKGEIHEKYKIRKDDILISWSATLDIFVWEGNDAWLNQHIFKVVFNKKDIDRNFFVYLIKYILDDMKKEVHGATMQHITKGKFDALQVPLPPLHIQKRIAEILDAADALRRKDQELLRKYDELTQAIFIDMFGDPVKNEKGWDEMLIKEISSKEKHSIKAGPFGSSLKKEFYKPTGYKIYGQEQVIADDFSIGDYYINDEKFDELKNCSIKSGDILISLVGTYGKISVVPDSFEKGIINPRLMKISLNRNLYNPYFFKFLLQTEQMYNRIGTFSRGGTMDIVNVGIISEVMVIVPPLDLQNKFMEMFFSINAQKKVSQKKISENLFDSLLQQAFKGELVK